VTVWAVAATPIPDREMLAGELVALLLTVILPVAAPLAEGANVEVSAVVCPGARVTPLAPVELNPAPAIITCAMVTLEFPALVIVMFLALLLDTFTFPKFKLLVLGFSDNVAAAPVVVTALQIVSLPVSVNPFK
jgi:hypothetical protein